MKYQNLHTYRSLLALSVGDAHGEGQMKLLPAGFVAEKYKAGNVADLRGITAEDFLPWTDDTHMAIGVTRTLFTHNTIDQTALAKEFAKNFYADKQRGYGRGTHGLLSVYGYDADNWLSHSRDWWGPNQGSKGNGSMMRDSVIGAHFGTNYELIAEEARKSAEVTHYNDNAIAASIAVAVAAGFVLHNNINDYWQTVLSYVPKTEVRDRIEWVASEEAFNETNWGVIVKVGNGKNVTALDTVPFVLWQAHQALFKRMSFGAVIDSIIEVGGDTDTVAAAVGGIIGSQIRPTTEQIARTEPLPHDLVVI